MGISLILTKYYDADLKETGNEIEHDDWINYIDLCEILRRKEDSYIDVNQSTRDIIQISSLPTDSEIFIEGTWFDFLQFSSGDLKCNYTDDMQDPNNPFRKEISKVAKHFSALIMTDASDDIFNW